MPQVQQITPMSVIKRQGFKPLLFEGLSEESLSILLQKSVVRDYSQGDILVQQGDTPKFVYLVLEGNVRTVRIGPEGTQTTIRMLSVGETCMDAVLFMNSVSPVQADVVNAAKILMIPCNFLKNRILVDEQLAKNMIQIVAKFYKSAIKQIDHLTNHSTLSRVGHYLLGEHLRAGHDHLQFVLSFKKNTIANHLGITPETFSRALAQIKRLGINIDGDTIKMVDAFVLCHFCDLESASQCEKHVNGVCPYHCPNN